MKTLGIIGGMGPMATAYFMQLIIKMSNAGTDQEHIKTYVSANPMIPDRTDFILNKEGAKDPRPYIIEEGRRLRESGAEILAIPCITAHAFHDDLTKGIGLPIVHAMEETAKYLKERGITSAGIMATDGTIKTGIFTEYLKQQSITPVICDSSDQAKVMDIIYNNVKAGRPINMENFYSVSANLRNRGAEVILLGCTELSVVNKERSIGPGYLDVLDVLSQKAVMTCGKLRDEYRELITV